MKHLVLFDQALKGKPASHSCEQVIGFSFLFPDIKTLSVGSMSTSKSYCMLYSIPDDSPNVHLCPDEYFPPWRSLKHSLAGLFSRETVSKHHGRRGFLKMHIIYSDLFPQIYSEANLCLYHTSQNSHWSSRIIPRYVCDLPGTHNKLQWT